MRADQWPGGQECRRQQRDATPCQAYRVLPARVDLQGRVTPSHGRVERLERSHQAGLANEPTAPGDLAAKALPYARPGRLDERAVRGPDSSAEQPPGIGVTLVQGPDPRRDRLAG
jgi:hypothetical protein